VDTYDGVNGSPDYGMIQESNNICGPSTVSVGGTSATGEEGLLPDTGPRPAPVERP